jgi:hypothetical protein
VVHVVIVVIAATLLTLNLFVWDVVFGDSASFLLKAAGFGALIRAPVLWFFWEGKNWARIVLLVIAIWGLLQVPAALNSRRANWVMIPQLAVNLFLWIWLNRPGGKAVVQARLSTRFQGCPAMKTATLWA